MRIYIARGKASSVARLHGLSPLSAGLSLCLALLLAATVPAGSTERLTFDVQPHAVQMVSEPAVTQEGANAVEPERADTVGLVALSEPVLVRQAHEDYAGRRFAGLFHEEPSETEQAPVEAAEEEDTDQSPTIQIVRDQKVERHLEYFNGTIRDRFETWLTRFGRYRPMVEQIFAEFGLPLELGYLSLVESGFNPRAYSRAHATGPWQFMKGTGRLYGLRINYYVDERRDPIKSTVAAAHHLRDLYDAFGSWPLAMAAYNAGEGKVRRALKRSKSESFYEIARTRYIRRETKEYVPRFMAATIIASNPDHYGFSPLPPDPHQFEEVIVSRPLHLRDIARATRLSYREFRSLNPELRRYITPPRDKEYLLKVPVGTKEKVEGALDQIPSWKRSTPPRMKGTKVPKGWYRVQLGDSLWKIAKRFRLSVRELKVRNNLSGWLIRPGDLLAIR